jgi:hypothetical protein
MIEDKLQGKDSRDKARIKSEEISKLDLRGKFSDPNSNIKIEITDHEQIENGIQVFAKAWRGTRKVGFGDDGTVEIERFRIFNPPVLVNDDNGDIERVYIDRDPETEEPEERRRKLRFDPQQAINESLFHTVSLVGKSGSNIVKGKIGNTTSTFYPAAGDDGYVQDYNRTTVWATARGAATGNGTGTSGTTQIINYLRHNVSGSNWGILRYFFPFDTSSIAETDTIDSATLSFYCTTIAGTGVETTIGIIAPTTQADVNALANADYDQCGSLNSPQEIATRPSIFSWSTSAYNDISLNSTGLAEISKTGYTKIGVRN